ncbi:6103_t:CDS:2 [Ambispora leptoticha]|uniref:6103_t:CDS:1 n=1 Tax=Ambispora leptoticha TaxID=144679 RepID=A0A9N8Z3L8_9GLOM|nr:6103_t:CDS:2 [Ambispora leptoticha]
MSKYTFTTALIFVIFFITTARSNLLLQKRDSFSGDGTYYNTGLGACGVVNSDSDLIAAINKPQWGDPANPNQNPICGKQAYVTGPKGSVTVKIMDMCPECAYGSLDFSPSAFNYIADQSAGRVHITWSWVDGGGTNTTIVVQLAITVEPAVNQAKVSLANVQCGGATCTSDAPCCSQYNYCGSTSDHCGTGCQPGKSFAGKCTASNSAQDVTTTKPTTKVKKVTKKKKKTKTSSAH